MANPLRESTTAANQLTQAKLPWLAKQADPVTPAIQGAQQGADYVQRVEAAADRRALNEAQMLEFQQRAGAYSQTLAIRAQQAETNAMVAEASMREHQARERLTKLQSASAELDLFKEVYNLPAIDLGGGKFGVWTAGPGGVIFEERDARDPEVQRKQALGDQTKRAAEAQINRDNRYGGGYGGGARAGNLGGLTAPELNAITAQIKEVRERINDIRGPYLPTAGTESKAKISDEEDLKARALEDQLEILQQRAFDASAPPMGPEPDPSGGAEEPDYAGMAIRHAQQRAVEALGIDLGMDSAQAFNAVSKMADRLEGSDLPEYQGLDREELIARILAKMRDGSPGSEHWRQLLQDNNKPFR